MWAHLHISSSVFTRRVEDGEKLCGDLMTLVKERANIEKEYAKQLKTWSTKWESIIQKGEQMLQVFIKTLSMAILMLVLLTKL